MKKEGKKNRNYFIFVRSCTIAIKIIGPSWRARYSMEQERLCLLDYESVLLVKILLKVLLKMKVPALI